MAYDAFISYSHTADGRLAPAVQSGLQRLARPWYRLRALRVFRDETGLAVNPHLWGSIEAALDESEYFVLLASPESAGSPWVAREIEHWMATKPVERILPVLTDGELVWDSSIGAYDVAASTALPSLLETAFPAEPRHLDLRWARTEDQLNLRHADFRASIAGLAAPIHGVSRDELEGEDVQQHRRTLGMAWGAAALLLFVTLAALVSASFAVSYASSARANEREALAERTLARRNAAEATQQRTLAIENASAARTAQDEAESNANEAADNAAEAQEQQMLAQQNAEESDRNAAEAQANGQEAEAQTIVAQQNAAEASANAARAETSARAAAQSAADAQRAADLAAAQRELAVQSAAVARQQRSEAVASATVARSRQLAASAINFFGTKPDRSLIMSVQANRFDANAQAQDSLMRTVQRQPRGLRGYLPADPAVGPATQVLTSPNRRYLATVGATGRISLTDLVKGTRLGAPAVTRQGLSQGVWFSSDSAWLAVQGSDGLVLWDIAAERTAATMAVPFELIVDVALSADHELLAVVASDGIHLLPVTRPGEDLPARLITLPESFGPFRLAFSSDHQMLAVSGVVGFDTQAQVLVFDTGTGLPIAVLPADTGGCTCVDPRGSVELRFDPGSRGETLTSVALGSADLTLISWDIGTWDRSREVPMFDELLANRELIAAVDLDRGTIVTNSALDSVARVRDLETGTLIADLDAHMGFCHACGANSTATRVLGFGPSGTVVAAGTDKLLRVFDLSQLDDRLAKTVPLETGPFSSSTVSADGRVAAVIGSGGRVSVLSTDDGHRLATFATPFTSSVWMALSADGTTLVLQSLSLDADFEQHDELSVWDVATGAMRWRRETGPLAPGPVSLDPSGQLLATILTTSPSDPDAGGALQLLDVLTGNVIATQPIDPWYTSPSFSADGRVVAIASFRVDAPVIVYDVAEHRIARTLDDQRLLGSTRVTFSADGRLAVAVPNHGGHLVVLDATTFSVVGELDTPGDVVEVAISADGDLIAAAVSGRATQLLDTRTGEPFGDPVGPALEGGPSARDLVLSSSARQLLMFSASSFIRVDVDPESWESQACAIAGRNLTRSEWTGLLGDEVPYEATCPRFPAGP